MGAEDLARQLQQPASFATAAPVLELAAAAFLAASAAAGFGITYLAGVPFSFEERIIFGAVVGPMVVAATSFAVSLPAHDVTVLTVSIGLLITVIAGAV